MMTEIRRVKVPISISSVKEELSKLCLQKKAYEVLAEEFTCECGYRFRASYHQGIFPEQTCCSLCYSSNLAITKIRTRWFQDSEGRII